MSLLQIANQFTQYLRTGSLPADLKINPQRAEVYLELFKNNMEDTLKRGYPLTVHLLSEEQWREIVDAFLRNEDSTSPYIWKMPQAFAEFVRSNNWQDRLKIPYLADLIDFEWLEIELFMMPDHPKKNFSRQGDLLNDILYFNPESTIVSYDYPVFEKKKLPREMQKGTYFLLAFRHPETGAIHFVSLSPFFLALLTLLKEKKLTGKKALIKAAKLFKLDEKQVFPQGEKFLSDLFEQSAIYGFIK